MRTRLTAAVGYLGALTLFATLGASETSLAQPGQIDRAVRPAVGSASWLVEDCTTRGGTAEQCNCLDQTARTKLTRRQLDYLAEVAPGVADPMMGMVLFSDAGTQEHRAWLGYSKALLDCHVGAKPDGGVDISSLAAGDYILASDAEIRRSPAVSSELVLSVSKGTDLQVVGPATGGWVPVQLGRQEGYLTLNAFKGSMKVGR